MATGLEVFNAAQIAILLRPPLFIVTQTNAQSLTSGTDTAITWTAPTVDTYNGWSAGNPSRWTPPMAGYYLVTVQVSWAVNSTGNRLAEIHKNGSATASYQEAMPATATGNQTTAAVSGIVQLNGSTDYIEAWGYQNSGGALNTNPAQTSMTAVLVRIA
jgi:hypothetical protein